MTVSSLDDYFEEVRKEALSECSKCGLCYQRCSLKGHISQDCLPGEAQDKVLAFLKEGIEDPVVYERSFSCLQCFKCVNNGCPQGIIPLHVNEIIKWDYRRKGSKIIKYNDPADKKSPQRILASIQIPPEDYRRITDKTEKKQTKHVFFPGCNVYEQPDKILSAIDILALITEDFAFLPGLDFCCGSEHLFNGDVEQAQRAMERLVRELKAYEPESVIVWCPTCLCRFDTTIAKIFDLPFKVVAYPQFIAENIGKLEIKKPINKTLTLHEACKSAFTKLDLSGTRAILQSMPGVRMVEMERHAETAVCCGLGALNYAQEITEYMRDDRLKEAGETNAEILIDVCHACHKLFSGVEDSYNYEIINYVSLLAQALGIAREDKFKKYIQFHDLKKILGAAETNIAESPYSREEIVKAIKDTISK
ncbi:MAG: (Fe-S)-binding protein [Peptococcaceae bacterium]